ncbi:segregation and condensation protein A [Spiroplasma gladiatoris]|uniref:Segregation and condensation protein A n=1 Tax=Spiroplasma gladiatoris TaxID=2143 RepID=A0A4V1AQ72_9MOLU|nr:segregation/condensation protein A [Spiroplasma gladiatoris]QBQ07489.1 segregation and condensation protein A [Spiroplasma gladiatoris]
MKERFNQIELDNFTGPLDLLLHMVKEKKISILEINLLDLSNQYVEYIKKFVNQDIEIASEYLVMAAYLIELKSKFLIPKEEINIDSSYEEDKRDELLSRLLEYHKIKEVTDFFKQQQSHGLKALSKSKSIIKITKIDDDKLPLAPNNIDLDKFSKIFLKAIEKSKFRTLETNTLTTTEISPEEIAAEIKKYLLKHQIEKIKLEDLIEKKDFSLRMLVATFMAVLDLASKKVIYIHQEGEEIIIENIWEGE